jgi:hypothetical protein
MSLDVDLMIMQPVSVFGNNITHNLTTMASHVKLTDDLTLYDVMWCPEEKGFYFARDISEWLDQAFNILLSEPNFYKTFNPENGWGSYDDLVQFVYKYRNACWDYPDAELRVSR